VLASASNDRTVQLWDAGTGAALETFKVDAVIETLSFSDDGRSLKTNRGTLYTTSISPGAVPSGRNLSCPVFVTEQWVTWAMENILWLPSEYRPWRAAVYGGVVALGSVSGRVSISEFRF